MIKSLINLIFNSKTKKELIKELRKNSSFKAVEELEKNPSLNSNVEILKLEKGEVKTVRLPDFGNLQGFYVSEWTKKNGQNIKSGDIVCVLENENMAIEVESIYCGKLIITSTLKQILSQNSELFKVEGI